MSALRCPRVLQGCPVVSRGVPSELGVVGRGAGRRGGPSRHRGSVCGPLRGRAKPRRRAGRAGEVGAVVGAERVPRAALDVGVLKQKQEEFVIGSEIAGLQLKTLGLARGIFEQTKAN